MTTPPRIHTVSHRGGALLWAENSLEAFRNSIRLGVDWLECDVHLSSDGVPMVIHDATLDRTTEGTGEVGRQSAAVLSQHGLRPGGVETVPRLDQVLALLAGGTQGLQIEIKGTGRQDLLQRTLEAVDSAGLRHRCAIIAFDATTAAAAVEAGGLADVAWLFSAAQLQRLGTAGIIATAARSGVPTVETEIDALQAGLCGTLRQAGLRLGAWGANDTRRLRKALELELDLVATDDPALALKLLRT